MLKKSLYFTERLSPSEGGRTCIYIQDILNYKGIPTACNNTLGEMCNFYNELYSNENISPFSSDIEIVI